MIWECCRNRRVHPLVSRLKEPSIDRMVSDHLLLSETPRIPDRDQAVGAAWLRDASKCRMSWMMTMMQAQINKQLHRRLLINPKRRVIVCAGTFQVFCMMGLRVGVDVAHLESLHNWAPCMWLASLQWASPGAASQGCVLPPQACEGQAHRRLLKLTLLSWVIE